MPPSLSLSTPPVNARARAGVRVVFAPPPLLALLVGARAAGRGAREDPKGARGRGRR